MHEGSDAKALPAAFSRWKTVRSMAMTGWIVALLTNPMMRAARYWDAATCSTLISVPLQNKHTQS